MAHISTVIHVVGNKHLIEVVETPTQVMKAITKQKIMEQEISELPKGFVNLTSSVTKRNIIVQIANIVSIESREG